MRTRAIMTALTAMMLGGGAGQLTPDERLRQDTFLDIYWTAARVCQGRFGTLRLDRVEMDGSVSLEAAADSRSELQPFTRCYHDEVRERAERRRAAGLLLPDSFDLTPGVDLD